TVADRDYILDFLSAAATSMMHLSRMSEEIVWYSSTEFSYLWIDDSFCTGSSIMPQKKNPDIAELLRGKPGRVYGDLMSALTIYKGTPLSFDKDFQEEKEATFDAIDTWKASIAILREHILNMRFRGDVLEAQLEKGYLNATDIAEHLVTTGMPFREAHELVGEMVHYCESKGGIRLEDMTDADMKAVDPRMNREKMGDISVEACVNARKSFGGTAPSEVRRQIAVAREWLKSITE
ncbi:MAG: argininosuccinate lyase, partial [Firmicutes bacterium]|nr:argininosuccinate lyase [Bacillota bacterium]